MVKNLILFLIVVFIGRETAEARLLMHTHGVTSFAPYVNGVIRNNNLYPGYSAEFMAYVDIFQNRKLIITGQVGNMTIISRSDSSIFTLDRIRYTLSPGFRYEFRTWLIRGSFHHESIYAISRTEDYNGAFWQNSIRLGIGSKGSYFLYLPERYKNTYNSFINKLDGQINVGAFLYGSHSIWVAKNHTYRYELFSLTRYHIGTFNNLVSFISLNQHVWIKADNSTEQKISITFNVFLRGTANFLGIFYTYTPYDTFSQNNENKLGALGLRILF